MARKKTVLSEDIISSGLQIVLKEGYDSLNARHLAEKMGTTTTPIFTNFGSMENLTYKIWEKANEECNAYLLESLKFNPAFKEFGMRFLNLAIEKPNIYRFVFLMPLSDNRLKTLKREEFFSVFKPVFDSVSNPMKLSYCGMAELIHCLIIFTSGLAVTYVVGKERPSKKAYNLMLTYLFDAISRYISEKGDLVSLEQYEKLLEKDEFCQE